MIERFEQKSLLGKRVIELYEDEVRIVLAHYITGKSEHYIGLHDIGNHIEFARFDYSDRGLSVIGISSLLLFVILGYILSFVTSIILGIAIAFVLFFIINMFLGDQYLDIRTRDALPVRVKVNRFTEAKGRAFLERVLQQAKAHIKATYMIVDADLPMDSQMENYYWLLINKIISQEEYEDLKATLKHKKGN